MRQRLFLISFAQAAFLFLISGSFVVADEQDYAGQEKILPESQSNVAPYTATFNIVKDPSFTYKLVFGDATKEGTLVCNGKDCSRIRITHTYTEPGLYAVEMFRVYPDDDNKVTAKSLRGLAGRAFVDVKEKNPVTPIPLCKVWFNGCVDCTRNAVGGPLACPKKQCLGALKPRACKEEFYVNKVPRVTIAGPASASEGISREWTITAVDPEKEKVSFAMRWGDETEAQKKQKLKRSSFPSFSHAYTAPGTYTATAYVQDASGGVGTATYTIKVRDAYAGVVCPRTYTPVCGEKDGQEQTFGNECSLNKARAKKKHAGAC